MSYYKNKNGFRFHANSKIYRSKLNKQVCIKCLKQYWPDADSVWNVQAEMKWETGRLYVCPHACSGRTGERRSGQYSEGHLIEHDPPEECPFKTEHLVSCNDQGFVGYDSRNEEYYKRNFEKI